MSKKSFLNSLQELFYSVERSVGEISGKKPIIYSKYQKQKIAITNIKQILVRMKQNNDFRRIDSQVYAILNMYEGVEMFCKYFEVEQHVRQCAPLFEAYQDQDISQVIFRFRKLCIPEFLRDVNMYHKIFDINLDLKKVD